MKHKVLLVLLGFLLVAVSSQTWANGKKEKIPFDDARIFIEVNETDGDSGLQIKLDAEGWKWVKVFDPNGKQIFHVVGGGGVRKTGLTELSFESAEPGFDELPLDEFLDRFPEGKYRFVGKTIEGDKLIGSATLTHTLPDAPVLLSPEEDSVQDPNDTVIEWEPVADPEGSEIVGYEVIVEQEEPVLRVFSAVLPATASSLTVSPEFLLSNTVYKYEVLAIEKSGNQTLSESTFKTAP